HKVYFMLSSILLWLVKLSPSALLFVLIPATSCAAMGNTTCTAFLPYFSDTYLLKPPDVPPVPNVQTILKSPRASPLSCNCWSISAAVTVLCASMLDVLSYCSGQ